jgi:hypothetical protein
MTMKSRRDRLARAKRIMQTLSRLTQARLALTEAQLVDLRASECGALQALDHAEPTLTLARLQSLTERRMGIEQEAEALRARALEYGGRAKQAEKSLEKAETQLRQQQALATAALFPAASARGKSGDLESFE